MITQAAIQKIRDSKRCRNRLAFLLNVGERTVIRYIDKNHIMLTTALALQIISEETGLKETEILELQNA